jgi:hypothetical protein
MLKGDVPLGKFLVKSPVLGRPASMTASAGISRGELGLSLELVPLNLIYAEH